ncbi:MAG: M20 family metallopeptidase [Acidimicrobiia bacterium]
MPPTIKSRVRDAVSTRADQLVDVSHQIHARPELGFVVHFAHDLLTGVLESAGFDVVRHAAELPTAFVATFGEGPAVGVMCEYDALPEIGHGCGHNVIATIGLGAALAAAEVAREVGGKVVVIGSPAEEGGGGKVLMAKHGVFDGLEAAMMVHPADRDLTHMDVVAIERMAVEYKGAAAHAAAAPHKGRNALDAAVLGYVNVAALRQHLAPSERVHGIITNGGVRPNVIPAHAGAEWYVRTPARHTLHSLVSRVHSCLEAGSHAAGCSMSISPIGQTYHDMVHSTPVVAAYVDNAAEVGRSVAVPSAGTRVIGSTDMGNVSYLLPSIHPMIQAAPEGTPLHSVDFARSAGSDMGDKAAIDGATALAMTVVDVWQDAELRHTARADLEFSTNGDKW